jgi:hypothetical protein
VLKKEKERKKEKKKERKKERRETQLYLFLSFSRCSVWIESCHSLDVAK